MAMRDRGGEMVDRYVYAVTRRLPVAQQADVDRELRSLIEDMLSAREAQGTDRTAEVEAVLIELGNPWELASNYRGKKRYLIGPDHYDLYEMIVKIVVGATGLGIIIALMVGYVFNPPETVFSTIGNFIGTVVSALFQAFAWVTIIFAIAERCNERNEAAKQVAWKVSDLPEVPAHTKRFSKAESIAGIICLVIFFMILNAAPSLFTMGIYTGEVWIAPVFNPEVFKQVLVLFNITIALAICVEFVKLYFGQYSPKLAVVMISIKTVTFIISLYIIGASGIWNPALPAALETYFHLGADFVASFARFWNFFPTLLIILTILGYVVETITTVYRSFWGKVVR
jgi:hypothetical protein